MRLLLLLLNPRNTHTKDRKDVSVPPRHSLCSDKARHWWSCGEDWSAVGQVKAWWWWWGRGGRGDWQLSTLSLGWRRRRGWTHCGQALADSADESAHIHQSFIYNFTHPPKFHLQLHTATKVSSTASHSNQSFIYNFTQQTKFHLQLHMATKVSSTTSHTLQSFIYNFTQQPKFHPQLHTPTKVSSTTSHSNQSFIYNFTHPPKFALQLHTAAKVSSTTSNSSQSFIYSFK